MLDILKSQKLAKTSIHQLLLFIEKNSASMQKNSSIQELYNKPIKPSPVFGCRADLWLGNQAAFPILLRVPG